MKTAAQASTVVSLGSWFRKVKAIVRREFRHALNLHLQNCAVMAESYKRK
jgi:hypothetical protein